MICYQSNSFVELSICTTLNIALIDLLDEAIARKMSGDFFVNVEDAIIRFEKWWLKQETTNCLEFP